MQRKEGISHEQVAQNRPWNKRPDGIAFKMPTRTKAGVICLLDFKRMSDVTNHYVIRVKREEEEQYEPLTSARSKSMQPWHQGWMVERISFIVRAWSLHEEDLKENLEYVKVPNASIESIKSKLVMKIFDEYAKHTKGHVYYTEYTI